MSGRSATSARVAAAAVRRRLPHAVGARRRRVRLEAVLPAQAVEHLVGVRRQLRPGVGGGGGLRAQRPRRTGRRHRARRRRELPADAVPAAQRHAQPAGDRPQRDPDHRAGGGVQQHVRDHVGDPAPPDGDAGRLLHRARQRRQGAAPGRGDAPRADALVRRHADAGADQDADPQRRALSVHGDPHRRPERRDRWPSSPSTSADRRTGSATASRRTCRTRGTPSPGPTCSAPACSGWRSTWSPSCWRASPHTRGADSPGGGST